MHTSNNPHTQSQSARHTPPRGPHSSSAAHQIKADEEAQALVTATLGNSAAVQRQDTLAEGSDQSFYLQYFFPPSSVGETGRVGAAGRREVRHTRLDMCGACDISRVGCATILGTWGTMGGVRHLHRLVFEGSARCVTSGDLCMV